MTDAQTNLVKAQAAKLVAAGTLCNVMANGEYDADELADVFKCVGVIVSTVADLLETALRVN